MEGGKVVVSIEIGMAGCRGKCGSNVGGASPVLALRGLQRLCGMGTEGAISYAAW